jgi:7-cyano-7-deazaguanine synthase
MSKRTKAVVCLSGGMDSCVCAALAARDHEAYGVHVSYGQRTEARERASAQRIAQRLEFTKLLTLKMDLFREIGGSALVDDSIAVPKAVKTEGISKRGPAAIPVTYVPFRNAHFLAAAVSWAEVLGATKVYIGAVEQDSSGYPDCRPAYYEAFNKLVKAGTREGKIEVVTPLIAMRKQAIVELGVALGAPLDLTWSCYSEGRAACGVCESCVLRKQAFMQAGVADPIKYAKSA